MEAKLNVTKVQSLAQLDKVEVDGDNGSSTSSRSESKLDYSLDSNKLSTTKMQASTQYLSRDAAESIKQNWRLVQFLNTIEEYQGVKFSSRDATKTVTHGGRLCASISSKETLLHREKNLKNEVTYKNLYITNPLVHNLKLVPLDSIRFQEPTKVALKHSLSTNLAQSVVAEGENESLTQVSLVKPHRETLMESVLANQLSPSARSLHKRFPINAHFVAQWISEAIVSSKTYKLSLLCDRVIKAAKLGLVKNTTNLSLVGLKIVISGRILGAEIATSKTFKTGQIPNNTITVLKDKGFALAKTRSGTIGVKVVYFWSV